MPRKKKIEAVETTPAASEEILTAETTVSPAIEAEAVPDENLALAGSLSEEEAEDEDDSVLLQDSDEEDSADEDEDDEDNFDEDEDEDFEDADADDEDGEEEEDEADEDLDDEDEEALEDEEEEEEESIPAAPARQERLQKILAAAGIASRRTAEELITEGRVQVNGQVINTLGAKADPTRDHIRVDGKLLQGAERLRYYMLNKPKGYVTTVKDPEGRPTVMEFFAKSRERLYPIGRLDYLSEGLLLVTNDGELAHKLTQAARGVEKVYLVKVAGQPTEEELERLRAGVMIHRGKPGDGRVRTAPARIRQVRLGDNPWFEVVLIEGRNRELRKMFEEIGHFVEKIRRIGYGPLVLDLEPGNMRELNEEELEVLRLAADGKLPKNKAALHVEELEKQLPTVRPFAADERPRRPGRLNFETRGPKRSFGDRPQRPYGERSEGRPAGRPYGERSEGRGPAGQGRPYGDRPQRPYGERNEGRPAGRPYGERSEGRGPAGQGRPFGDRPQRPYGERNAGRPAGRPYGERSEGRGPAGQGRPFGDRPQRPFGERNEGRPAGRPYGERSEGRGPAGQGRPFGDRPQRPFGERREGPGKSFGDRGNVRRPFDQDRKFGQDKPAGKKNFFADDDDAPRKSSKIFIEPVEHSERPRAPRPEGVRPFVKREGGFSDRPRQNFGNRPRPSFGGSSEGRSGYAGRGEGRPAFGGSGEDRRPAGRSFGGPREERGDAPRGNRSFGDRPAKPFGARSEGRPSGPNRGGAQSSGRNRSGGFSKPGGSSRPGGFKSRPGGSRPGGKPAGKRGPGGGKRY